MDSTYTYPKLRWPIDLQLQRAVDSEVLVIRCPLGVTEQPLLLVPDVAPIIVLFDGSLSFQQILDRFAAQGLSSEVLEQLIRLLDENLFMTNDRFFAASQRIKDDFRSNAVRVPSLAGLSYPAQSDTLAALVDGYLHPLAHPSAKKLCGIIAPHIDYRRGGSCYGEIYPYLNHIECDLYILIGTAHQYSTGLFHLCAKDFSCPLGIAECDREFVATLAAGYGLERAFADEFLHKREHSLELQLPFLARYKPHSTIVPILVGGFHHMLSSGKRPHDFEEYEAFASALAQCITNYSDAGKRVGFIAGVDMAHVGASFGDPGRLTAERMRDIAIRDSEYLAAVCSGDRELLFNHVAKDSDARRICGFPSLYTVLDVLSRTSGGCTGEVVKYDQTVDYSSDCAVTFAGVTLSAAERVIGSG